MWLEAIPSISNYRSFHFFDPKIDHLSFSKICANYHFFCCELLYQYKILKGELNLAIFVQFFLNKTSDQTNNNLERM